MKMNQSFINELPIESLIQIFEILDDRSGLLRCICPWWKDIIDRFINHPLITLTDVLFESDAIYQWSNYCVTSFTRETYLKHRKPLMMNEPHFINLMCVKQSSMNVSLILSIINNYCIDLLPFIDVSQIANNNIKKEILYNIFFVIEPPSPNDTRLLDWAIANLNKFAPDLDSMLIDHPELMTMDQFNQLIDDETIANLSKKNKSFSCNACFNTIQRIPAIAPLCSDITFTLAQFNQIIKSIEIDSWDKWQWIVMMAQEVLMNDEIESVIKQKDLTKFLLLMSDESDLFLHATRSDGCLSFLGKLIQYQFTDAILVMEGLIQRKFSSLIRNNQNSSKMFRALKDEGLYDHPEPNFIRFMNDHLFLPTSDVINIVLMSYDSTIDKDLKNFLSIVDHRSTKIEASIVQKMKDINCAKILLKNDPGWFFHIETVGDQFIVDSLLSESDFEIFRHLFNLNHNRKIHYKDERSILLWMILSDTIPYLPHGKRLLDHYIKDHWVTSMRTIEEKWDLYRSSKPHILIQLHKDGYLTDVPFPTVTLLYIDCEYLDYFWQPGYFDDPNVCTKMWEKLQAMSASYSTPERRKMIIDVIQWLIEHGCTFESNTDQWNICLILAELDRIDLYESLFFKNHAAMRKGEKLFRFDDPESFELQHYSNFYSNDCLNFLSNVTHLFSTSV